MKHEINTDIRWAPLKGYEGRYEICEMGKLRSLDRTVTYVDGRRGLFRGRELRGARGANGYLEVTLEARRHLVHRLVAETFLPAIEGKDHVNHINGDKRDNRICNLEWCSPGDNNRHARDTGLQNQHGENSNLARYGDQLVAAVRRVNEKYSPTYRELAMLFDMSIQQATDIAKGKTRRR